MILSGSVQGSWVWSTEGSLVVTFAEPSGYTSPSYIRPMEG
jgi:hypothetical protein